MLSLALISYNVQNLFKIVLIRDIITKNVLDEV